MIFNSTSLQHNYTDSVQFEFLAKLELSKQLVF
jgi:hypothetical protein